MANGCQWGNDVLERNQSLRKQEVNTQAELEAAQARDKQTRAAVVNLQAIINKKIIRAPFDGRAGIRAVELGQVVSPGTPIVSLQTVSPIYAEFQLPQQALADVKLGQKVTLKVDVFPGKSWEGTVTTINPEVDPATRNVRMRAMPVRRSSSRRPPSSTRPTATRCTWSRSRRTARTPRPTRTTRQPRRRRRRPPTASPRSSPASSSSASESGVVTSSRC